MTTRKNRKNRNVSAETVSDETGVLVSGPTNIVIGSEPETVEPKPAPESAPVPASLPVTGGKRKTRNQPITDVYNAARADSRIANLSDTTIRDYITTRLPVHGAPRTAYTAIERLRRIARAVEIGHPLETAIEFGNGYNYLSKIRKPATTETETNSENKSE